MDALGEREALWFLRIHRAAEQMWHPVIASTLWTLLPHPGRGDHILSNPSQPLDEIRAYHAISSAGGRSCSR